jgi:pimeloyl-ACP methyl ester carboxylesterase
VRGSPRSPSGEAAHPPAGRFVEVDGGRVHVLELGQRGGKAGRAETGAADLYWPIVLVHGASGNLGDLRLSLGDRLARTRRVILVDRPGHGWSDRPGGAQDATPARQAALIAQALERIGVERFVLLGHSLGGAVATAFALAYPDRLAGLVLLAPVTHPWSGGLSWYNALLTTPVAGPLFAHALALSRASARNLRRPTQRCGVIKPLLSLSGHGSGGVLAGGRRCRVACS